MVKRSLLYYLCFFLPTLGARSISSKYSCPGIAVTVSNVQCCKWFNVLHHLQAVVFDGAQCGKAARSAIRLTFHDSIGLSRSLQSSGKFGGGGADGSIIKFANVELGYYANTGLEDIVDALKPIADHHNVSYGDIIQFSGAVALTNCPGAPRLQFLIGRLNAVGPSPPNLVPAPFDPVHKILSRMEDAGFTADDTVALLAAHSVSLQEIMDPTIPGTPMDSTPGVFDSQFYLETMLNGKLFPGTGRAKGEAKSPLPGQFRLESDAAIARAPQTACKWQSFIYEQSAMKAAFREAMAKVATNGQNIKGLIDCSEVIPTALVSNRPAMLPEGSTLADVERSCFNSPFPSLSNQRRINDV